MAEARIVRGAPVYPPAKVVLELTMEEAETILAAIHCVGGNLRRSRRGIADRVQLALLVAGVGIDTRDLRSGPVIWFEDRAAASPATEKEAMDQRREAAALGICSGRPATPDYP